MGTQRAPRVTRHRDLREGLSEPDIDAIRRAIRTRHPGHLGTTPGPARLSKRTSPARVQDSMGGRYITHLRANRG